MKRKMRLIRLIILGCCFLIPRASLFKIFPENAEIPREPYLLKHPHSQHAPKPIHGGPTRAYNENSKSNKASPDFVYNLNLRPSAKRRILVRDPRGSEQDKVKNLMTYSVDNEKDETNQVLIKAPIPRFYELDYEDDFHKHLDKLNVRHAVDSGSEREDDDFNIGDYEFDVNHDEFLGQGKPIEPKVKILDNILISDLMRNEEENLQLLSKPVAVTEDKSVVKQHLSGTYKPGQQTDSDVENETKSTSSDIDDTKYGGTGDHYDKGVNNGKFTIFGGSPKYSLLLVPWW